MGGLLYSQGQGKGKEYRCIVRTDLYQLSHDQLTNASPTNSNFGKKHLEDLLSTSPKYVPAVNQIDLHPFMARVELVEYCKSKDIVLEAWAPLVRGERFNHPVVVETAKKYGKSPAQILIRYGLDRVRRSFTTIDQARTDGRKSRVDRVSSLFLNRLVRIVSLITQTFSTLFLRKKTLM